MSIKYTAPDKTSVGQKKEAASTNNANADITKVKICSGHTRPICHINYSEIIDGTFWLVTSCHDAKPMLRNGETGDWVGSFEGHKGAVYCSAFNQPATRLVTGSGDYSSIVWNAITGEKIHTWNHPKYIKSCDWVENKVATGCFDGLVRIFDANAYNAEPLSFDSPEKVNQVKATYFIDPTTMVTACETVIMKWDLRDTSRPYLRKEIPGLNFLEYTHRNCIVAAHEKSISFIDTTSLDIKSSFTTSEDVECASLSPNGQNVAAGSKLKAKEFTLDGTEIECHRGHHGPIFHIRWAPDGNSFTSGAEDGMARIWPSHDIIETYDAEN
ncbi:putative eukaryotic translation initiation factor 3 subunit [Trypanosoma grayi]|uniref:putative eukaryotic translation initiation factor 3 subunit n=1 Tax=Trypanosoma grayi TaxID=71804 RepID=UPI0004F41669|nr:putative eukaryotic translation initiation factor 3 subunit [Trypanosoma grayi]KEG05538.1 putative eukaryotic translation initiation factor 3 subunit [Trypanosoma grayi]